MLIQVIRFVSGLLSPRALFSIKFASGHLIHDTERFARRDDATAVPGPVWTDTGECYSCDDQKHNIKASKNPYKEM